MSTDNPRPLGEWLQQRREELDLSLEQAAEATRIRLSYLQALESEDLDALPNPVVARGFLRNYAAYLDLDPQDAVSRYSERVAPPEPESLAVEGPTPFNVEPFRPVPLHDIPAGRGRRLWIVGLAAILVIALGLLGWWAAPSISDWLGRQEWGASRRAATATMEMEPTEEARSTATRTVAVAATSTREATATDDEATPTLELTLTPTLTPSPSPMPSPSVYTGIFLELVFTDTSWIQVTVDGVRQFQGELDAETYRSWYGEERIELRIGNAGAVQITVNGQFLGTLGAPGDVVDRVFEKVGENVSAATFTPAPTTDLTVQPPTDTPAPTVLPTSTLTPTLTLTLTPTSTVSP